MAFSAQSEQDERFRSAQSLEREFHCNLNQPGRCGTDDLTKCRTRNVPINRSSANELWTVEDVEGLQPNVERPGSSERHNLNQTHVDVFDPRSVEETPRRVPQLSERRDAEARRVERRPVRRIVVDLEVASRRVVRRIDEMVVDTVAESAQ
jgi:hypothetical protein